MGCCEDDAVSIASSVAMTASVDASTGAAFGAARVIGSEDIAMTKLAAGDSLTFGNGVDVILDFVSATDKLDTLGTAGAFSGLINSREWDQTLFASTNYLVYGSWNTSTNVFTTAASYDAQTNNDALVVVGNGTATFINSTNYVLLVDLVGSLAATDFI